MLNAHNYFGNLINNIAYDPRIKQKSKMRFDLYDNTLSRVTIIIAHHTITLVLLVHLVHLSIDLPVMAPRIYDQELLLWQ